MSHSPCVSIGLPVFNGGGHLDEAIRSILSQTFTSFELIIADNGSSDATEAICKRFAANDQRVRYFRHDENIGAALNFNFAFTQASAPLFKWAAHDDVLAPIYLEKCVAMMDARPDAVLCQSVVKVVGRENEVLDTYDNATCGSGDPRPSKRFGGKLAVSYCMDVFGVVRTAALKETPLIRDYIGSDRTLLLELSLKGPMLAVDEPLLIKRKYSTYKETAERGPRELLAWYAPRQKRQAMSTWCLFSDGCRMIARSKLELPERLAAAGWLVRSLGRRWYWALLLLEPFNKVEPRIFLLARSIKRSLFDSRRRSLEARSQ